MATLKNNQHPVICTHHVNASYLWPATPDISQDSRVMKITTRYLEKKSVKKKHVPALVAGQEKETWLLARREGILGNEENCACGRWCVFAS